MKKLALVVVAAICLMVVASGCNATRGAGKDISDAGKHIQNVGN